jgi:hypothetical protein
MLKKRRVEIILQGKLSKHRCNTKHHMPAAMGISRPRGRPGGAKRSLSTSASVGAKRMPISGARCARERSSTALLGAKLRRAPLTCFALKHRLDKDCQFVVMHGVDIRHATSVGKMDDI